MCVSHLKFNKLPFQAYSKNRTNKRVEAARESSNDDVVKCVGFMSSRDEER